MEDNRPKQNSHDPLKCSGQVCRLESITPLARKLNCLDMKQIADICVTDMPKLVGARLASLYILDDTSDILHLEKNNHPFLINNIVSLNQKPPSPMVAAVRSKNLILVGDIDDIKKPSSNKISRAFSKNYNTKSCIIAPLICQNRVVGVLNLSDKADGGTFGRADVAAIELFRQLIGASIGNVKLFEKSQRLAQTDGLTGMYNHRTFYETLEAELRRAERYGGQISIIMADIDNLKPINDNYGHRAGDLAISQIARRIRACIRQIDIPARYGGDEFAVILPNTTLSDAERVANRIVSMVKGTPMYWEQNEIPLSISVGVGQYNSRSAPGDVTKATDQAMYAAKQAGKGTVKVFETQSVL
ncbi:Stalked cell differentiation-controlling protein [Anaerohalosphaera lusitana]|uniref:diguanylate cyclase n=1 Tax=Anaerohalosphaera lusitana TaxID=1936003 RepID=A0A1U9NKS6_9BACT|nr:sensor domain-containing diguanylate cyclase [Anaerohalosphaera lusitana]AQT68415.1 Stalked cell differentiation-controlling protein [Anaerohalosphaera lusitana]